MENLEKWRNQIDEIDDKVITLLGERMSVTEKIGEYKKVHNLPPLDEKRFESLLDKLVQKGKKLHLPESLIKKVYNTIHEYSVKKQESQKNNV